MYQRLDLSGTPLFGSDKFTNATVDPSDRKRVSGRAHQLDDTKRQIRGSSSDQLSPRHDAVLKVGEKKTTAPLVTFHSCKQGHNNAVTVKQTYGMNILKKAGQRPAPRIITGSSSLVKVDTTCNKLHSDSRIETEKEGREVERSSASDESNVLGNPNVRCPTQ